MVFKNIRALRENNNIKQRQLAGILGIRQNTYSRYENGKIEFTAEMLLKLADFYKTSLDYLLDRTNQKDPYPKESENEPKNMTSN